MSEDLRPALHPDADVLNAFLEGALQEHERAGCLVHLADCAQCREVVFLAREGAEADAPAAVKDAAVPFFRRLLRPLLGGAILDDPIGRAEADGDSQG